MDIKLLESNKKEGKYVFHLKGVDYTFMNFIRRAIMTEIPTMAIDEVIFYTNESVMPDEFLANRLALVPIKAESTEDAKGYIKKTGGMVYSGDIISNDIEIPYKKIPLLKLKKGKSIELEIKISKGYGKYHVKWQPAFVYYRNKIALEGKTKVALKNLCPKGLIKKDGSKFVLKNPEKCDLCKFCVNNTGLDMKFLDDEFYLYIELFKNKDIEDVFIDLDNYLKEYFKKVKTKLK